MRPIRPQKRRRTLTFSEMRSLHLILVVIVLLAVAGEVGCGGSGSSSTPGQIALVSGSGQSAVVGAAFSAPLVVKVEDSSNNPASGASVTFTAPSSGASGTFANGKATETDTTDSNGEATSSTLTANSTVGGPYDVTAAASGVSTTVTFNLSNTPPGVIALYAGSSQTGLLNMPFAVNLQAQVSVGGVPVPEATVVFTAPASGASGMFATTPPSTTATVNTNPQGIATAPTFTANGTAGAYAVVASSSGLPSANFALTNAAQQPLTAGNYVFSLKGTNATGNAYMVAGVFTVEAGGAITTGEQSFADFSHVESAEPILNTSTISATADGNLLITLQTGDLYIGPGGGLEGKGNGQEVLDAAMISSSKFGLIESDAWASGSGELDLQTSASALCPVTPCGYVFESSGLNSSGNSLAIGGVINIDQANGAISGSGSVFDADVANADHTGSTTYLSQSLTATSTVSAPDSLGRVTFNLNSNSGVTGPGVPGIALDGYIIDAKRIRLVEDALNDSLAGTLGGMALAQTGTGTFGTNSLSGSSYVVGLDGIDNAHGAFQVAGLFVANNDVNLSVGGFLNYNDLSVSGTQQPVAISGGSYAVDSTGRVTMKADTAGPSVNLELYLTGDGDAAAISLDSTDIIAGLGYEQSAGILDTSSFSGIYAMHTTGADAANKDELDSVGSFTASGAGTLTGIVDLNWILNAGYPIDGLTVSGTFADSSNGVLTGTLTGLDVTNPSNHDGFTYYLIDNTRAVAIETDANQLTLGFFELKQ